MIFSLSNIAPLWGDKMDRIKKKKLKFCILAIPVIPKMWVVAPRWAAKELQVGHEVIYKKSVLYYLL